MGWQCRLLLLFLRRKDFSTDFGRQQQQKLNSITVVGGSDSLVLQSSEKLWDPVLINRGTHEGAEHMSKNCKQGVQINFRG